MIYAGVRAIADVFDTRDLVDERLEVLEEQVQSNFPRGLKAVSAALNWIFGAEHVQPLSPRY